MRLRTADISIIFVSRDTKRGCGACVHAATHTNNEISLPQDNTVMHAWSDSDAPTARSTESYNCYRGKLHVPCVPLRNSTVTFLSLARKPLQFANYTAFYSFSFTTNNIRHVTTRSCVRCRCDCDDSFDY